MTGWPAYPKTSASVRELAEQIDADPDDLAEAFAVLRGEDHLTDEQHALLIALINARYTPSVAIPKAIPASVAEWQERFAKKGYAA